MPRKSAAALAAAAGDSSTSPSHNRASLSLEGDTTMLSVTTDVSHTSKSGRGSSKAEKGAGDAGPGADSLGIDDLLLPRTLTSRLARGILPPNTSIQKDALLALTKAASVFISYLASHSNEVTQKKTIGPADVIQAIEEIEMAGVMGIGAVGPDGKVGGRLERELEVWEGVVRGKRKGYRDKVKARESGAGADGESEHKEGEDGERDAKRARVDLEPEHSHTEPMSPTTRPQVPSGTASTGEPAKHLPNGQGMPPANGTTGEASRKAGSATLSEDGDETQPDGEDEEAEEEDEEDDEEEEEEDEDDEEDEDNEINGYGPDEQLRHDMNGGTGGGGGGRHGEDDDTADEESE